MKSGRIRGDAHTPLQSWALLTMSRGQRMGNTIENSHMQETGGNAPIATRCFGCLFFDCRFGVFFVVLLSCSSVWLNLRLFSFFSFSLSIPDAKWLLSCRCDAEHTSQAEHVQKHIRVS